MQRRVMLLAMSLILASSVAAQPPKEFDGKSWWQHVKVLADDKMEGRDTGSPGLRKAQEYIIEQLKRDGLQPAGSKGYWQPVKFVARRVVEKESSAVLIHDGKPESLSLGEDTYFNTRVNLAPDVQAPLVFVGYGLQIPDKNYDDLAGLDLKGKVVVLLVGSPAEIPTALASHAQTAKERWRPLHDAGAVGIITIANPASMDIPWSRISLNRNHVQMDLAYPEFDDTKGEKLALTFNPAQAEKLFAGSGHTFQEVAELGKDRKPLPHFPLAVAIKTHAKLEIEPVESANIVAKLPGSDPKVKGEYVVLSAHTDHVGIGEPVNGDRIYNGAMDDGSGSAVLLDIAARMKSQPEKIRRSILFLFVTAEEKGLLGSKYFASHPTVDRKAIVADINVDMFLPIVPLKVLRVQGLAESDLGDEAREVAAADGVRVQPDPEPLRNLFVRSDQYSFIRQGIPSIIMDVGFDPGTPQQKVFKDWLTHRYHAPSDDLDQPVDLEAAGTYEQIVHGLLISVANADARPQWKPDSFFRRFAH